MKYNTIQRYEAGLFTKNPKHKPFGTKPGIMTCPQ